MGWGVCMLPTTLLFDSCPVLLSASSLHARQNRNMQNKRLNPHHLNHSFTRASRQARCTRARLPRRQARQQSLRFSFFWLPFCDVTSIRRDFQKHLHILLIYCDLCALTSRACCISTPVPCLSFLNNLPMGTPAKKNEMETNSRCAQNSNGGDGV